MRTIRFGVIGGGLMGAEFASAAARWLHLKGLDFRPEIVAVADLSPAVREWFVAQVPTCRLATTDYRELLANPSIDAIYCAVPHHLHEAIYIDVIRSGKHLMAEKPFGIDLPAARRIIEVIKAHPEVLVRCSSEFPFFPGAQRLVRLVHEGFFGDVFEVRAGFYHSSDLDPTKPINWKRVVAMNGEYGCMGDLGLHVLHLPMRFGWRAERVSAALSNIVRERLDGKGGQAPCETWDNATLLIETQGPKMLLETKRIAPGEMNTWFISIYGTHGSAEFSTKAPKQVRVLRFEPGRPQVWQTEEFGSQSVYPSITGGIFEFGFSDSILQMWAAFCDELVNGEQMVGSFRCATPEEALLSHEVFTEALKSA